MDQQTKPLINDDLEPIPPVLAVSPTLRGRFIEIALGALLCWFFIQWLNKVPAYGMHFDTLLGLKMRLLHFKLSYEVLAWPLRIGALLSFGYSAYIVIQQKTTVYELNDLNLIWTRGVFNRTSDSTDLVNIRDQRLFRSIVDRLLGLSKLQIISIDKSNPEMMMRHITAGDANKVTNFLRKYAFQNYTEYRIAKDKEKQRQNRRRVDRDSPGAIIEDDDDGV